MCVPTLLTPQAAVALHRVSIAFQGRQMGKVLRTDAKPVYCVYYASGVTSLNPCASQQGNAPHAMLLVDSHPFNSLLKMQHTAVAAVPWKYPWCAPKSRRAWCSAGVRPCNPGHAWHSWLIRCRHSFLPERAQARPHTSRRLHFKYSPSAGLFQVFLGELESGFRQQHTHKCHLFELNLLFCCSLRDISKEHTSLCASRPENGF